MKITALDYGYFKKKKKTVKEVNIDLKGLTEIQTTSYNLQD